MPVGVTQFSHLYTGKPMDLANATRVADRLYAIDRGEIIFEGDPRAAYANEEVMKTIRG